MRKYILFICTIYSIIFSTASLAEPFKLVSTAFVDQSILPVLYTCDGKDISPELSWMNTPNKTETYALVVADQDAPGGVFYHWILYNLPKSQTNLAQDINTFPVGTLIGKNNFDNLKYNGPCPPKGSSHHYVFTLYALDTKLALNEGATGDEVMKALENHVIEKAAITAVYSRWLQ